jgi:hypothetical protein
MTNAPPVIAIAKLPEEIGTPILYALRLKGVGPGPPNPLVISRAGVALDARDVLIFTLVRTHRTRACQNEKWPLRTSGFAVGLPYNAATAGAPCRAQVPWGEIP